MQKILFDRCSNIYSSIHPCKQCKNSRTFSVSVGATAHKRQSLSTNNMLNVDLKMGEDVDLGIHRSHWVVAVDRRRNSDNDRLSLCLVVVLNNRHFVVFPLCRLLLPVAKFTSEMNALKLILKIRQIVLLFLNKYEQLQFTKLQNES